MRYCINTAVTAAERGIYPDGYFGERPVVVQEMAFICLGISHVKNYYCVGVQAVRLIDTERRHCRDIILRCFT